MRTPPHVITTCSCAHGRRRFPCRRASRSVQRSPEYPAAGPSFLKRSVKAPARGTSFLPSRTETRIGPATQQTRDRLPMLNAVVATNNICQPALVLQSCGRGRPGSGTVPARKMCSPGGSGPMVRKRQFTSPSPQRPTPNRGTYCRDATETGKTHRYRLTNRGRGNGTRQCRNTRPSPW